jgi:hypothetical protein
MSREAGGEDTTAGGVTWYDIYESPQVERSLLGKGVLDVGRPVAAGRPGQGVLRRRPVHHP